MEFIPLVKPHLPPFDDLKDDFRAAIDSGRLTNFGPYASALEKEIAALFDVKHVASVSNATTGLMMLLNTLPEGSEVIVPSFTFLPTVQAVIWNRLVPVFADIDPGTLNLSADAVIERMSPNTSAILAVNVFGNPCDIESLEAIARKHGIKLLFDSAHAFGSRYNGRLLGGFGDAEVFSLSATKTLPCGEGGIVTTNDTKLYEEICNRRNYGFLNGGRDCNNYGMNGKLSEMSAILGLHELKFLDEEISRRNLLAAMYKEKLASISSIRFQDTKESLSTYKDFVVLLDCLSELQRNNLKGYLMSRNVQTEAYFSPAIHQMQFFKKFHTSTLFNTEYAQSHILSLPLYYDLSEHQVEYVSTCLIQHLSSQSTSDVFIGDGPAGVCC